MANVLELHQWDEFILHEGVFPFWEKGHSQLIELHPKHTTEYCLSIEYELVKYSTEQYFNGSLQIDLLHKGVVVESTTFGPAEIGTSSLAPGKESFCLNKFYLPYKDWYWDDLSIRITVIKPDEQLKQYQDTMIFRIENGYLP